MKTTGICPKCASRQILFVRDVADASEGFEARTRLWQLAIVTRDGDPAARAGYVQAFLCRNCGYTELYVFDVANIPIDGSRVIELHADEPGPYR